MSLRPRDLLLMLLIQLIWGINFVVVKVGLAHMPSLFFVAMGAAFGRRMAQPVDCLLIILRRPGVIAPSTKTGI